MLKQSKKQQYNPKTEMSGNNINLELKNENMASVSHVGQQKNVELITIINFIGKTMKNFLNCGEQLKT